MWKQCVSKQRVRLPVSSEHNNEKNRPRIETERGVGFAISMFGTDEESVCIASLAGGPFGDSLRHFPFQLGENSMNNVDRKERRQMLEIQMHLKRWTRSQGLIALLEEIRLPGGLNTRRQSGKTAKGH